MGKHGDKTHPTNVLIAGDSALPGILLLNTEGRILNLDARAARYLQDSPEACRETNILETVPFQNAPHLQKAMHSYLRKTRQQQVATPFMEQGENLSIQGSPASEGIFLLLSSAKPHSQARTGLQNVHNYLAEANLEVRTIEKQDTDAKEPQLSASHTDLLRRLLSRLIMAEQGERRKLADELHDYLPQVLVGGKIQLAKAQRKIQDKATLDMLQKTRGAFDQALQYTRTLVANLSPTALYVFGLKAALDHLKQQNKALGLRVHIHQEGQEQKLSDEQAVFAYQAIRELLHNTVKHARTKEAEISLDWTPHQLLITVADHGAGFDTRKITNTQPHNAKFGLFSIQERLESFGGIWELESRPGQGTQVKISMPLKQH